jgi:hypothetical protein
LFAPRDLQLWRRLGSTLFAASVRINVGGGYAVFCHQTPNLLYDSTRLFRAQRIGLRLQSLDFCLQGF